MSEPAAPDLPPTPWEPLSAGFRKHGLVGKVFIVLHSVLALLFITAEVLGSGGSTRLIAIFLALAALELAIAIGVALHKRLFLVLALALSVLGLVGGLYALTRAWPQPLLIVVCLAALALNVLFVRYFGRLQRRFLEDALAANDQGPPSSPGAV